MSDITSLIVAVVIVGLLLGLIAAFPAMILWNYFAPAFDLPILTFWQMVAITIFLRLVIPTSSSKE